MRRWVVVGAGAVGGTIGGRLHQGGAEVAFVARGAHGAALRADGLLLRDPDGDARLPIPTYERPAEVPWTDDDVVILATKTQDAADVLDALADAVPDAPIVCATNGLAAERMALRRFAAVHGMCVMLPATHLEAGVVDAWSAPCSGILDLGLATGGHDAVDTELATALRAGHFESEPTDAVLRRKRTKLLANLVNVLQAACGNDPDIGPLAESARAEGRAVYAAAGLDHATDEEDEARRAGHLRLRPIGGERRHGGSTWQSVARGADRTEVDFLNGEIVLLGRLHGVPCPVNAGLQRLARHLVASGAPPASMTPADVEAWLATVTRR